MGKCGFKLLLLFIFIFLLTDFSAGQENYAVTTLTTEHGLPHNHVYQITQDQTGFLWIATWDGLSRWNGYEFRNYRHNPSDSTSISYFLTEDVIIDTNNNVWVCGPGFLSKYNRKTDNFTQFKQQKYFGASLNNDGELWSGSRNGIYHWDEEKEGFQRVTIQMNEQFNQLSKIYPIGVKFDNLNQLWIFGNDNNQTVLGKCEQLSADEFKMNFVAKFDQSVYVVPFQNNTSFRFQLFVSDNKKYWLLSNYGVFLLDAVTEKFLPFKEFDPEIHLAGLDRRWISKAKEYSQFFRLGIETDLASNTRESAVAETYLIDRQKTLWQAFMKKGGVAGGLTRSIPTSKGFKHYFFDQNESGALNAIFPVVKDRFGTVWAGPANLNKFFWNDNYGKTTTVVPIEDVIKKTARQPRAFLEDSAGMWIGYFNSLLLRYDFKSKQFKKELFKITDPFDTLFPWSFLHLKEVGDEIFVFGFKSIFTYNTSNGKIRRCKLFDVSFNLYSVLRDENKGWWVGGNLGLILHYDNQFNEVSRYTIGAGLFNIEEIVEGDHNDLWISQLGGGIARLDKLTGKTQIFTTADGLSNNTCYGMLKDKRGNIWVSTNHGISRFNPQIGQFRTYGPEDGLKIDEFNSDNAYLAPDGEMFFGGMGGVVSFYPDSLTDTKENNVISPLVIEDFKVSGTNRYFSKAIYECDTVTLNKGDNNFQLTFACLDFRNAEKIKYRYRLNGEDTDFVQTDFRH